MAKAVKPISKTKRSLSTQHRKAISEGLKLHHKRKRRSKTIIGRIVNKLTHDTHSKTRKAQRLAKRNQNIKAKTAAKVAINNQIHAAQVRLANIRKEISNLSKQRPSTSVNNRKDQLHMQADATVKQLQQLRKRKSQ